MSQQLLLILISFGVPLLSALLVPVVTYYANLLLSKLPSKQRSLVEAIVQTGVSAAQQMAGDATSSEAKKQAALQLIDAELQHRNITVPAPVLNAMLEAAVLSLKTATAK